MASHGNKPKPFWAYAAAPSVQQTRAPTTSSDNTAADPWSYINLNGTQPQAPPAANVFATSAEQTTNHAFIEQSFHVKQKKAKNARSEQESAQSTTAHQQEVVDNAVDAMNANEWDDDVWGGGSLPDAVNGSMQASAHVQVRDIVLISSVTICSCSAQMPYRI